MENENKKKQRKERNKIMLNSEKWRKKEKDIRKEYYTLVPLGGKKRRRRGRVGKRGKREDYKCGSDLTKGKIRVFREHNEGNRTATGQGRSHQPMKEKAGVVVSVSVFSKHPSWDTRRGTSSTIFILGSSRTVAVVPAMALLRSRLAALDGKVSRLWRRSDWSWSSRRLVFSNASAPF